MSLWHKPLSEVGISDVEEFLDLAQPEGTHLDYKSDFPSDLEKLVASFANTMGGLILIGVDSNQTDNTPIVPACGIPSRKGISEQITQICRDNIYPSIQPEIKVVSTGQKVVVVVRVDPSPQMPHAIRNKTRVYIRTGDVSTPINLAEIDRIAEMFKARRRLEEQRASLVQTACERANYMFRIRKRAPIFWYSLVPLLPNCTLCQPSVCDEMVRPYGRLYSQRVPNGAIAICEIAALDHETDRLSRFPGDMYSLDSFGHVFLARVQHRTRQEQHDLHLPSICQQLNELIDRAKIYFGNEQVGYVSHLVLTVGAIGVQDHQMEGYDRFGDVVGRPFPDTEFETSRPLTMQELLDAAPPREVHLPSDITRQLVAEVGFSFDVEYRFN